MEIRTDLKTSLYPVVVNESLDRQFDIDIKLTSFYPPYVQRVKYLFNDNLFCVYWNFRALLDVKGLVL